MLALADVSLTSDSCWGFAGFMCTLLRSWYMHQVSISHSGCHGGLHGSSSALVQHMTL
jgi:hypothetical protein